ncbi:DUF2939 domain-containing protein [Acinetobacter baumannii]|nr:DUF2939 domain-containing protein [Acinetobacter baumannii]MDI9692372.1 DUF2939 domain-containing protein [Acinetobacter baumannii]MDO7412147.1 DUF2939 domain-containing protein [Acinetobacter baumannii]
MNKKLIGAIIAAVIVLVGGYYYASPYLALNSIKSAAQAGDSEKISKYIDYPSVRQSFKDQMNAYMFKEMASKEANGWEALGAMMASTMVDKMIDAFITPEGMTLMLQGKDLKSTSNSSDEHQVSEAKEKTKPEYISRYTSMNDFEVVVKDQDKDKEVKVMMVRDGLSWKINKIVVPLEK